MKNIKYIILCLFMFYLLTNINIKEYFSNKINDTEYNLNNTKIIIKNNILYLINKKDRAVYSKFNINTYNSDSLYFRKIFENINKEKKKKIY